MTQKKFQSVHLPFYTTTPPKKEETENNTHLVIQTVWHSKLDISWLISTFILFRVKSYKHSPRQSDHPALVMPHRWWSIWRCWSPRLACSHSLRCYSENATVKLDHNPRDENQKIDEYHQPRWWLLTIYTVHHCFQDSFLLSWSIIQCPYISWYSGTPWSKKTIIHQSGEPMDLSGRSPQLSVFTCEVLWGCYRSAKSQDAQHSENMKHHDILYRIGVFPSTFEWFPYSRIWSTQGEVRLLQFVLVYLSMKPNLPKIQQNISRC